MTDQAKSSALLPVPGVAGRSIYSSPWVTGPAASAAVRLRGADSYSSTQGSTIGSSVRSSATWITGSGRGSKRGSGARAAVP